MRHANCVVIAVVVFANAAALIGQSLKIDFEKDEVGKPPKGWIAVWHALQELI